MRGVHNKLSSDIFMRLIEKANNNVLIALYISVQEGVIDHERYFLVYLMLVRPRFQQHDDVPIACIIC